MTEIEHLSPVLTKEQAIVIAISFRLVKHRKRK